MKKVLFILGPTGVGKSDMAIDIAQRFNGEIISADSVQVFRHLNIGSAKITQEEMRGVVHHCIDILPPDAEFSVFEYVVLTKKLIDEIISRKHLPIIVGGTGLYVKALTLGYDFGGAGNTKDIRAKYQQIAKEKGLKYLYDKIKELAPNLVEKVSENDEKRIIRAFEIYEGGQTPALIDNQLDAKIFALNMPRDVLYERINKRVDIMVGNGFIEEVKGLLDMGLSAENQSMKAIGYKEVIQYIDGSISKQDMLELVKKNTRNYAKRQLTFCRGIEGLEFVDVSNREQAKSEIYKKVEEWL
jgi:tRNA dimethylallyltransferase